MNIHGHSAVLVLVAIAWVNSGVRADQPLGTTSYCLKLKLSQHAGRYMLSSHSSAWLGTTLPLGMQG